jgi:hypothetical protein
MHVTPEPGRSCSINDPGVPDKPVLRHRILDRTKGESGPNVSASGLPSGTACIRRNP